METGLRNSFWATPDPLSRAPDVQVSSPLPSLCLAQLEAPYAVLLETHSLTTSHPRTHVLHKQGPKLCLNLVTFSFFFPKRAKRYFSHCFVGRKSPACPYDSFWWALDDVALIHDDSVGIWRELNGTFSR